MHAVFPCVIPMVKVMALPNDNALCAAIEYCLHDAVKLMLDYKLVEDELNLPGAVSCFGNTKEQIGALI